jgi:phosphoglycolate phosphatase/putative hydrolase of the HAD superfamily
MRVYALPRQCAALLFDMDSTLYTHPGYQRAQLDLPLERLARLRGNGATLEQMRAEIDRVRNTRAAEHGGQISMGTAFTFFGVSIEESVRWREELYRPEQYLAEDKRLRAALEALAARFRLAVVTNNPVSIARRTLAVLGAGDLFAAIVGLDTCGVSKPHEAPFRTAAELCGAAIDACVSVGDRYDIDIALPLKMGMGGVLVDGVEDVYRLPEALPVKE